MKHKVPTSKQVMLRKARNRRRNARAKLASVKAPVVRRQRRLRRLRSTWAQHGIEVWTHRSRLEKRRSGRSFGHRGSSRTLSAERARAERRRQRAHRRLMRSRT
ncbi:MAG: hypothetical protein WC683_07760 [bacterium]